MGQTQQRGYRLTSPITTNTPLGTFNTLCLDNIILIICQLNTSDMQTIKLVCHSFEKIVRPFLKQCVGHFPADINSQQSYLPSFYDTGKRFMNPHLIPQPLAIKPGDSDQHDDSESPIGCLMMRKCKEFPAGINTSQVRSLIISILRVMSNHSCEVFDFLTSHDLSNVRALALHNVFTNASLLEEYSELLPKLVCFSVFCKLEENLNFETFNFLEELHISTSHFRPIRLGKKLKICTIYISGDGGLFHHDAIIYMINLDACEFIEVFKLTCDPLYQGRKVTVMPPRVPSLIIFELNATRKQCNIRRGTGKDWESNLREYSVYGESLDCSSPSKIWGCSKLGIYSIVIAFIILIVSLYLSYIGF